MAHRKPYIASKAIRIKTEWYLLYRSYENNRRLGVAIFDMQISILPLISGYKRAAPALLMTPVVSLALNTRRKVTSMTEELYCIRQAEDIRSHLWHRHFVTDNQVMMMIVNLPWYQQSSIKEIPIWSTSHGISSELLEIYSICSFVLLDSCCTFKWKIHHSEIKIISFVEKFHTQPVLSVNFQV